MFKYILLFIIVGICLLSGYGWYSTNSSHSAFNCGAYLVLVFWCISRIVED